jgi:superfamily II DNA or RNA helicase
VIPNSLRSLSPRPIYFLPDARFLDEFLIPGLRVASAFDAMVGYFSSTSLSDLAPGLAAYLQRNTAPMRLVISPQVSEADFAALEEGVITPSALVEDRLREALGSVEMSSDALAAHTLLCLAYLLSRGRLTIKVALAPRGIFHPKVWLLMQSGDVVSAHGSSNMTGPGIDGNVEQLSVDRSWGDPREQDVVDDLRGFFSSLWSGVGSDRYPVVAVYDLPEAIRKDLLRRVPREPPTELDFDRIRRSTSLVSRRTEPRPAGRLQIPETLDVHNGPFAHQGKAVSAWEEANRRGILSMATGSGKTITALAAASRLAGTVDGLLVVIAAPQLPLLSMWEAEVRSFGVEPISLARGTASRKLKQAEAAIRRLKLGVTPVEVLVVTHDLLVDDRFHAVLSGLDTERSLLIGDEVHRLGRPEFLRAPPESFGYRLGLSATPERQFDPEGSAALEAYFGPQVFEFGLGQAIGVCLVPFDYHVQLVELSASEEAEWRRLTDKIAKLARAASSSEELEDRLKLLLIRRRRILETASGKVPSLRRILARDAPIARSLIYATDKDPLQLRDVNALLEDLGVMYHQVTSDETSGGLLADATIAAFRAGYLQALTAKRVLDEGINVPAMRTAYVLASTTVRRQWVQRLGRVLRLDPASGKEHATYHDFVALPDPARGRDDQARRMLTDELERIRFFGLHARNQAPSEGWLRAANEITATYFA